MKSITVEEITAAVRQLCMDVSYDLPADVERALQAGLEREESSFGQYCLTQIIQNCQMARESRQAMCQDTGIAVVYLEVGQDVHIVGGSLTDAVNEGVRQGYEDGYLRKSVVMEPLFSRENTGDNTPAVIHTEIVSGENLRILVVPKGAGSSRNPNPLYAALEEELLGEINKMGIGPQGLGGRVTALAVHIEYYPTHIAMLPVAVNLNCHAARHREVIL